MERVTCCSSTADEGEGAGEDEVRGGEKDRRVKSGLRRRVILGEGGGGDGGIGAEGSACAEHIHQEHAGTGGGQSTLGMNS